MRRHWLDDKTRLDRLFAHYEKLPPLELEIRSHWVAYLVVRTSGFLENAINGIYIDYAHAKATSRIANYVDRRLRRSTNYTMDNLERLMCDFDTAWYEELKLLERFDQISNSVDSIVNNRHQIAHGRMISTTISQLTQWYECILELLDKIYEQCESEIQSSRSTSSRRRRNN